MAAGGLCKWSGQLPEGPRGKAKRAGPAARGRLAWFLARLILARLIFARPYWRRAFSGAMKACLTVQRVICTCMGPGLAVHRVLCTSSQLARMCKEPFARRKYREIHSIEILVPKILDHVHHPPNRQKIAKTTPFR